MEKNEYKEFIDKINNIVGENIKKLRAKEGLTLVELAKKIDVTDSMISKYEKGKAKVSPEKLQKFSEAFGCTVKELTTTVEQTKEPQNMNPISSLLELQKPLLKWQEPEVLDLSKSPIIMAIELNASTDFNRQEKKEDLSLDEFKIIHKYRMLNDKQRKKFVKIIDNFLVFGDRLKISYK